jgi:hypothetical protein
VIGHKFLFYGKDGTIERIFKAKSDRQFFAACIGIGIYESG